MTRSTRSARTSTRQSRLPLLLPRGGRQAGIGNFARATKPGVSTTNNEPSKKRKLDQSNHDHQTASQKKKLPPTTPPKTPTRFTDDLLHLHSSFLKALTFHYAYNGTPTPADLGELLPSIEHIWKKRKVTISDLQRLVWVWDRTTKDLFRIVNYGRGKVCLEIGSSFSGSHHDDLQNRFEALVDDSFQEGEKMLGLAPVHTCLTTTPSLRKGQQRLEDFKTTINKAKNTEKAEKPSNGGNNAMDRRRNLLERVKTKQLHQPPAPPSKEMLLRRAAAEHVQDVVRILASLRPSSAGVQQRRPFRIDTIAEYVADSICNPISRHEIDVCLDILASHVAPEWVSIVTVKDVKSVVLKSYSHVSSHEIAERVSQLSIDWIC